jgi:hypothetical protein
VEGWRLQQILSRALAAIFDLKWYWTAGPGRGKWSTWTELHAHLRKFLSPGMAKRVTSAWYHAATGHWVGEKKGKNPRGYG